MIEGKNKTLRWSQENYQINIAFFVIIVFFVNFLVRNSYLLNLSTDRTGPKSA